MYLKILFTYMGGQRYRHADIQTHGLEQTNFNKLDTLWPAVWVHAQFKNYNTQQF